MLKHDEAKQKRDEVRIHINLISFPTNRIFFGKRIFRMIKEGSG